MNKSGKWIVKLLMILILGLVLADFILSEPKYVLTEWIVICLALVVILALSDVFDNLSIPKVISLSKDIKEAKKENSELKETNLKLMEQIVNIKNINNQSSIIHIYGSNDIESVVSKEDISDEIEHDLPRKNKKEPEDNQSNIEKTLKYRKYLETLLLEKTLKIDDSEEVTDKKFDVKLDTIYNNSKTTSLFDALMSTPKENVFYEVKTNPYINDLTFNRIKSLVKSLQSYNEINNIPSRLVLIIPNFDDKLNSLFTTYGNDNEILLKEKIRMLNLSFDKNIFEVKQVAITKKELDKYVKEKELEKNNKKENQI